MPKLSKLSCLTGAMALSVMLRIAFAQPPSVATTAVPVPKPAAEDPLGRGNPRGCLRGFLKAAGEDDYATAAQYLDTEAKSAQALELARELKIVLDRGLSGNFDKVPRTPDGNLQGGLPPTRQKIGSVRTKSGTVDLILDRVQRESGPPVWLFASKTLEKIPQAFHDFEPWNLARYIPRALVDIRFLSLPLWRWFSILLTIPLLLVSAFFLTSALTPLLRLLLRRITGEQDDRRLTSLRIPLAVVLLAVAVRLIARLAFSLVARQVWTGIARLIATVGVSWLVIAIFNVACALSIYRLTLNQALDKIALVALIRRSFHILVVLIAIIVLLRGAGVNITAMLAGLGIGGVALALAAQKTLENFFGGISIIMREVVRVGDFCKIADQIGTIEDVGFGSTRIRTLDRTVVSVSNAQVSQTSIENYSMRDKCWFHQIFGLASDTSPERVRQILAQTAELLRSHPNMEMESSRIQLIAFGRQSLDVEIFAYIRETDYAKFLKAQEELLLQIMDIIAVNGARVAMPSQITRFDREKRGASSSRESLPEAPDLQKLQPKPELAP